MVETKVVIIGAGVAGLSCALYLKRANVPFLLLEKGAPGGKLLTIPHIGNYPGHDDISGPDLAVDILNSALRVGVEVGYGDVQNVHFEGTRFVVETDVDKYLCDAVVVATGLANIPTIKGEKEMTGKGVSYCATCDGPLFKGKDVAVYGTGDRTLEEALYLASLANKVYLISPLDHVEASEFLLEKLRSSKIEVYLESKIVEIEKNDAVLQRIFIETKGERKPLEVAAAFPLVGEKSASAFLSPLKINLVNGFVEVDVDQMSEIPGLFAAGDIVKKKLRQVVTAASDGAVASNGVIGYLRKVGAK
ncbi:MAG: FAD-dependent oxidoreductase [Bacilli bacterium]|nr:FAD-dependent oxidoreductase [Bacilli bacterium]